MVHTTYSMFHLKGLASIEPWLEDAGYEITHTRLFEATEFADAKKIDFLVIMGGPMSVNDEDKIPLACFRKAVCS